MGKTFDFGNTQGTAGPVVAVDGNIIGLTADKTGAKLELSSCKLAMGTMPSEIKFSETA